MTEQDKEIFEKYCKLEEALRIAKDALRQINKGEIRNSFIKELPSNIQLKFAWMRIIAELALKQIDEALK